MWNPVFLRHESQRGTVREDEEDRLEGKKDKRG
jgi:hypothetical protein